MRVAASSADLRLKMPLAGCLLLFGTVSMVVSQNATETTSVTPATTTLVANSTSPELKINGASTDIAAINTERTTTGTTSETLKVDNTTETAMLSTIVESTSLTTIAGSTTLSTVGGTTALSSEVVSTPPSTTADDTSLGPLIEFTTENPTVGNATVSTEMLEPVQNNSTIAPNLFTNATGIPFTTGAPIVSGRAVVNVAFQSIGLIDFNNQLTVQAMLQKACTILEHRFPSSGAQVYIQQFRAGLGCVPL
ncbi:hypothetical protein NDU88_001265 [Pleurodeles waltl]|uniref:SEA domain-containing protein n=1 Tax=Pleurodeles waltl TaxID=8319 RepID=A0AAV7Q3H0_PLEWA|nr:hypothetical protein NDU88_001265 [Pleurodeles waltl]